MEKQIRSIAVLIGGYFLAYIVLGMTTTTLGAAEGTVDVCVNVLLVWIRPLKIGSLMNAPHLFFGLGALISPLILAQVIRRTGGVRLGYWLIVVLIVPIAIILFPQKSPKATAFPDSGSAPASRVLLPLLIAAFFFFHVAEESSNGSWIYTYTVTKKLADEVSAAWIATPTYGISLAWLFPGTITLARQHLHVTAGVTGFFLVGSSLGAMALPWLIGQFFESVGPQVFPAFITSAIAGSIVLPAVTLILLRQRVTDG